MPQPKKGSQRTRRSTTVVRAARKARFLESRAGIVAEPPPPRESAQRRSITRAERDARLDHACVMAEGVPTYLLVPIAEYERLVKSDMAREAIAEIESGVEDDIVDAGMFGLELAGEEIAKARKAAGLTQTQLGARLGIPQSMISRVERNPDRTTLRTLKRIAKALKVDVRALISLA